MAARQQRIMPDYLREQPVAVGPANRRGDDGRHRRLFLDAGRVLMLWGWGALVATVMSSAAAGTNGERHDPCSGAVHAFLGFVLWLVGASFVALVPVARQFPLAARLGTAVANAVTNGLFPN